MVIRPEQKLRHRIFSWYVLHWNSKYSDNWESFVNEQKDNFENHFNKEKVIAPTGSLLATNLQFVLDLIQRRFKLSSEQNIKNVLLFFYNKNKSKPLKKDSNEFKPINIDYSEEIKGIFINLESEKASTNRR